MSAALERVIAEQQAVIDRYKVKNNSLARSCIQNLARERKFVEAAFDFLNNSKSIEARNRLRQLLVDHGWCLTCENSPCECDE